MRRFIVSPLINFLTKHPKLAVVMLALYFFVPIDLIPEALLGFYGYIDDLMILTLTTLAWGLMRKKKISESDKKTPPVIDTTAEAVDKERPL